MYSNEEKIVMKFKFKSENREQKRNKEMFYARVEITVIIMYGRVLLQIYRQADQLKCWKKEDRVTSYIFFINTHLGKKMESPKPQKSLRDITLSSCTST